MCVTLRWQLYGDVTPKTVENFVRLCTGEGGVSYAGSNVYKILKDFNIQVRDFNMHTQPIVTHRSAVMGGLTELHGTHDPECDCTVGIGSCVLIDG